MKIAIIGCGNISRLTHAPNVSKDRHVSQVLFHDLDARSARDMASQYKKGIAVGERDEVWMQRPDGVVIATRPDTHYQFAKEALQRGIHALVEKPLALTRDEALELVEIAEDNGVTVAGTCHQPIMAETGLKALADGVIGEHRGTEYLWCYREQVGAPEGRVRRDLASHAFAMAFASWRWRHTEALVSAREMGDADFISVVTDAGLAEIKLERRASMIAPYEVKAVFKGTAGDIEVPLQTSTVYKADWRPKVIRPDGSWDALSDAMSAARAREILTQRWLGGIAGGGGAPVPVMGKGYAEIVDCEAAANRSVADSGEFKSAIV